MTCSLAVADCGDGDSARVVGNPETDRLSDGRVNLRVAPD